MTHSRNASRLIAKWEGFRAEPYFCPAGYPTIGYGHIIQPQEKELKSASLTQEQAMALLEKDLSSRYTPQLNNLCAKIGVELTQNQYDACLSFLYNCGAANLERSNILGFTKAGKMSEASAKFGLYTKAKVNGLMQVLPGLVKRRKEEAELFTRK